MAGRALAGDEHEERDHRSEVRQLGNMYFGDDRVAAYVAGLLILPVTVCNVTEIMKFARIIHLA